MFRLYLEFGNLSADLLHLRDELDGIHLADVFGTNLGKSQLGQTLIAEFGVIARVGEQLFLDRSGCVFQVSDLAAYISAERIELAW